FASTLMASTSKSPASTSSLRSLDNCGSDLRQGPHHEAQKSTYTIFPRYSLSDCVASAFSSGSRKSGAGLAACAPGAVRHIADRKHATNRNARPRRSRYACVELSAEERAGLRVGNLFMIIRARLQENSSSV